MSDTTSKTDILMMFVDRDGGTIWAESTLDVFKGDPLVKGFNAIDDYNDYSNFFEISSFNFSMALNPTDQGTSTLTQASTAMGSASPVAQDQFSSWRSANKYDKPIPYPVEFDTFSFTRVIDAASPIFFHHCTHQHSFRHASLVKRVAVGSAGGKSQQSVGYMRIDFRDVLLTGINWDDGDLVTESVTFICKAMRIRYAKQKDSGGVETSPVEVTWDEAKDGSANSSGAS
jgi:type VI protein secretion system component Hcp